MWVSGTRDREGQPRKERNRRKKKWVRENPFRVVRLLRGSIFTLVDALFQRDRVRN